MSWTATSRYGSAVAERGLAIVQDLLNTIAAGRPRQVDLLADLDGAQTWLDAVVVSWADATGRPALQVTLDERGLDELRALRADLRGVVGAPEATGPASVMTELRLVSVGLALGADGLMRLEPRGQAARVVVGIVLIEVLEAQRADTWRRLKTCRNERCAVAFYDHSRNNSGAWHDVRVCGNAANLRASRARRRRLLSAAE